jgi:hypothetical protein
MSPKGKKLLLLGGVVVVGGAAAYMLLRPSSASAQTPPPIDPALLAAEQAAAAAAGPGGPTTADCTRLHQQKVQLQQQSAPDPGQIQHLEAQIAACVRQVQESGGAPDPVISQQASGDAIYARINQIFDEFTATEYSDVLKRGNIRKDISEAAPAMATAYSQAVAQSANVLTTENVRVSIARALDAAIRRRACYLYDGRGCGRYDGSVEPHGNDKAAQEQREVIEPLLVAYRAAAAKGVPGNSGIGTETFVRALLFTATSAKSYIDSKFDQYRSIDGVDGTGSSNPARRNELRGEMLRAGREMGVAFKDAIDAAEQYRDVAAITLISAAALAAFSASCDRYLCFYMGAPGCRTFGTNEDQGDTKARQERDVIATPMSAVCARACASEMRRGNASALEPFVAIKTRVASTLKDFIAAKFDEYKSVSNTDAVRRNNVRQVILASGGQMLPWLQEALSATIEVADVRQLHFTLTPEKAAISRHPAALQRSMSGMGASSFSAANSLFLAASPKTPVSSKGSGLVAVALPVRPPVGVATVPPPPVVSPYVLSSIQSVRSVLSVAVAAFDQSVARELCFTFSEPGCGTFAVNEDQGDVKARQEREGISDPLSAVCVQAIRFLAANGDTSADGPFMAAKMQTISRLVAHAAGKFTELKSVDYVDGLRRNNIRREIVNTEEGIAQRLGAAVADAATPLGRLTIAAQTIRARRAVQLRQQCYKTEAPGCGRWDDVGYNAAGFLSFGASTGQREADAATKFGESERALAALDAVSAQIRSAPSGVSGLGQAASGSLSTGAWVGIGTAILLGGALFVGSRSKPPRANGRKRRRTSRRMHQ